MPIDYETGEDFSAGGTMLRDPGCYHMIVTDIRAPGANKEGKPIPNSMFTVQCSVGDGTVSNRKGKTIELNFFEPKASAKDGGAFQRKKSDRFLLAVGLLSEEDLGKRLKIEIEKAVGRQFCVKLEANTNKGKDGKEREYLDIAFADIYHVDDPEVTDWPKDAEMLSHIPMTLRKIGGKRAEDPKQPGKEAEGLDL